MRLAAAALCLAATAVGAAPTPEDADRLVANALSGTGAWETLTGLSDGIGPRLSGSKNAELAVQWTTARFRSWGIDVRNEKVMVPRWVRGEERARLISHNDQLLSVTALGGSVATPRRGVTAEVVEVASYDELKALGRAGVAGRIVFFDRAMDMSLVESGRAFEAYSKAVEFRSRGADYGAEFGAVAIVIRSVASASLRTPHTGALRYGGSQPKIPAAALSVEDALLLHRLLAKGEKVRMQLVLTPRTLPDVESANVVAEIRGSSLPDEIVLIGGHLDSWDLATGSIDNAAGVSMVMETMRLLKTLGIQPRRTVRAVLFMNEENGLRGARAYAKDHAAEIDKHVAAIESDAGAAAPIGFTTTTTGDALAALQSRVMPLLQRIGALTFVTTRDTGADTGPLVEAGVPGFGFVPDPRRYFDYHHSPADTVDKINPDDLAKDTAAVAALTYVLADQEQTLPHLKVVRTRP